jgi:hypothetical protein
MKLMTELIESVGYLIEGSGNDKKYYIEGIFAQADTPNRNGRIYPRGIMENALGKFQPIITAKRAMGELNHPQGPTINLDRVSHLIEKMEWNGSDVHGRAKVLDTPMGRIAKNLIDENVQLGVSTRGLGSLKTNSRGVNEVQNDFMLNTVDIVGDPSGPSCFVNGILESREWYVTDDGILEDRIVAQLKKKKITEERKLAAFASFMTSLNG